MNRHEKSVYLTFDDGPIPESTPFILRTLEEYQVKATFFMVGENVLRHHDLYNEVVAAGHAVGNHSFNHISGLKHSLFKYINNVDLAAQLIDSHLYRPPHGWMRPSQYAWLGRKYRVILWDVITRDYSRWMTAEDVFANVRHYTRNGSIITFHDSRKSIGKLQYALPASLEWLKEQGYECKIF